MSVTAIVVMLSVNVVALSDAVLSVAVAIAVLLSVTAVLQSDAVLSVAVSLMQ